MAESQKVASKGNSPRQDSAPKKIAIAECLMGEHSDGLLFGSRNNYAIAPLYGKELSRGPRGLNKQARKRLGVFVPLASEGGA